MYLSNKTISKIYQLYFKNPVTGKINKITTKTKIKSEAMKFVSVFTNKPNSKNQIPIKVIYLSDIQGEIFKYVTDNFTKNTLSIYKNSLSTFGKMFKDKPLKLISVKDIENYKNFRLQTVGKTTINIDIVTLKATFNLLIRWNVLTNNMFNDVKKFKVEEKKRDCFTDSEINRLVNSIKEKDFRNLVLTGVYTGCRISEIINIQYKDVDLSNRILTIGNKEDFNTKSKRIREIPISDNLLTVLQDAMNIDSNIFTIDNQQKYLFTIRGKYKMNRDYVTRKFKKYLRELNVEGCFHSMRHTFITNLIKSGVSINYVKEIAGHSDIKTTMLYVHLTTNDLREAMNKVNYA